jgi:UDP-2,3-diacylglucosamine pyrophosphatase LpxH
LFFVKRPEEDFMPVMKMVISDLHLADGHPILDSFGQRQQRALEELLRAVPFDGTAGGTRDVELIINGDCFDLLVIPPYLEDGISTPTLALAKLEKIFSAHAPFFETLRRFIESPGRLLTFITGNHDIELFFAEARAAIQKAIGGHYQESRVRFILARGYRPLPDVHIEHGHHYDFWNHAANLWDEHGSPITDAPQSITLPVGSQFFQRVMHPISVAYPYFDHFEPSIDSTRQIALLSLLDPDMVIEAARHTMKMLSYPRVALEGLAGGEEHVPAKLFEHAMLDFAAFQQDLTARADDWEPAGRYLKTHPDGQRDEQAEVIMEFFRLRDALAQPPIEAARAILAPATYPMGEQVAIGMQNVLRHDPTLRYAIAGHTHMLRSDTLGNGGQRYLNTASWTLREARPAPDEVTPEMLAWLRHPVPERSLLRDVTKLVFARIESEEGKPSRATLCAWEGGPTGFSSKGVGLPRPLNLIQ